MANPHIRAIALDGLLHIIQYRRKDIGAEWRAMAGFDVLSPAEEYFKKQDKTDDWPYEYRLIEVSSFDE